MSLIFRKGICFTGALLFYFSFSSCKRKQPVKDDVVINMEDTSSAGKAIIALTEKIKEDPSDAALYFQRSKLFLDQRNVENADKDIRIALSIDSSKSAYFLQQGDIAFVMNKIRKAKADMQRARAMEPSNFDAAFRLAEINLYIRDYATSLAYIDTVLMHDRKNLKAYLMQGVDYKEAGDTTRAINSFQAAIEVNPDYYDAYMQLGIIMQARNNKLAVDYFNRALAIRPGSEEALYGRGLWYQDHGDYDKAIQDYTTITLANPRNRNAHFNLGYIHYVYLKVYDEAVKHYTNAIDADPKYAEAYYNRGLAFETLGNIGRAKQDYQRAMELRPNYALAIEGLKRVSK